jgi:hypothetical protein
MSQQPVKRHIRDFIMEQITAGNIDPNSCMHLDQAANVVPSADGCEECLQMGDSWVTLRICLICGHVGCCDNSKNRHATKHFGATSHPLIQSFEQGEDWIWCYTDQQLVYS